MRPLRSSLLVALLASLPLVTGVAGCAGCKGKQTGAPDAAASASASALPGGLTPEQASKVLAKFGDHVITLGDFARTLADMPEYERIRYQGVDRRKELLKGMIDVQLLADEAKKRGLDKDPVVQEELRQVLVGWMRSKLLAELPAPSDLPEADVRAYYDGHPEQFHEVERRRIAQVLTRDEAKAKQAYDEAKSATPPVWGTIVRKYTEESPPGTEAIDLAGDVGFVTAPEDSHAPLSQRVTTEMRTAAFALKDVNEVTAPFKDGKGWHVVRLLSKQAARVQGYADVAMQIRYRMLQERRADAEKKLIEATRAQVKVEIDEAAIDAVAATLAIEGATIGSASSSASSSASAPVSPLASTKPVASH
ncbi:MAG: peptidyl-prolyl cis-trans isomerase [Polyangiales bacterium]